MEAEEAEEAGEVLARRPGRLRQQVTCCHGQTCSSAASAGDSVAAAVMTQ